MNRRNIALALSISCLLGSVSEPIYASDIFSNIAGTAGDVIDKASDLGKTAGDAASGFADQAGNAASDFADNAKDFSHVAGDTIASTAQTVGDSLVGLAGRAGDAAILVGNYLADAGIQIGVAAGDMGAATADTFDNIVASMPDTVDQILDSVDDASDIVVDSAGNVRDFAVDAGEAVSDTASNAAAIIGAKGAELSQIAQESLEGIDLSDEKNWDAAQSAVMGAIDSAYESGTLGKAIKLDQDTTEMIATLVVASMMYGYQYQQGQIDLAVYTSSMSAVIIQEGLPCGVGFVAGKLTTPYVGEAAKQATLYLITLAYESAEEPDTEIETEAETEK